MKLLLLDIETAPNLAYVWGTWKQNINPEWIAANGYVLCWSAKWLGEREITFRRLRNDNHGALLRPIHRLLDQADAVVHYNGKKFDIPVLNKEFLTHGMTPPAPYKQIDLLSTMWKVFRFPNNKLSYIAKTLKIGEKTKTAGPQLWLDCMAGNADAWCRMEEYNRQDVVLLERLYMKLRPWVPSHPNAGVHDDAPGACPTCGGTHITRQGYKVTRVMKYPQYKCVNCGSWFRGTKTISPRMEKFVP